jgi:methyl-accepting chemotaxis protein
MTVGTKLSIGVGSMLALMMVMGLSSWQSISSMNRELEAATRKTAIRLQLAGTMDTAGSDMLAGMRGIVMFAFGKNPSKMEMSVQQCDSAAAVWQQSIDEVRPLIIREDGRKLVNQLQEQLSAWRLVIVDVEKAARQGDPNQALTTALTRGLPIYEANSRDSAQFAAIQRELLAQQTAAGDATYHRSVWIVLSLSVLALTSGLGVFLVTRNVNKTLRSAATELKEGADQVASAATQVANSSQLLAQGASEQSASLEETSSSSEEINSMAEKNNENSAAAAALVTESQSKFRAARRSLDEMVISMSEINTESGKIARIIKVIDEIAFQTNILALNAAVEAARAGESGLGFAVVADEVRNLAQRCAQAARDTAELIEGSVSKSTAGKLKVDQVAAAIHAVTEEFEKVKTLVDEVRQGSHEQTRGIGQVSQAVAQMQQVTQSTAAGAEESASAAEQLNAQSEVLKEVVSRLVAMVGDEASRGRG